MHVVWTFAHYEVCKIYCGHIEVVGMALVSVEGYATMAYTILLAHRPLKLNSLSIVTACIIIIFLLLDFNYTAWLQYSYIGGVLVPVWPHGSVVRVAKS